MTDENPGPVADDDHNDQPPPASTATRQHQPADTDAPDEPANVSASPMAVLPQNYRARQTTQDSAPTYSLYKYKKSTYCAGESEKSSSMSLPPCLIGVKPRQQQDIQSALRQLPEQQSQDVLDELQARSQRGVVRNAIAYFFGLIKRALAGEFHFWAGGHTSPTFAACWASPRMPVSLPPCSCRTRGGSLIQHEQAQTLALPDQAGRPDGLTGRAADSVSGTAIGHRPPRHD